MQDPPANGRRAAVARRASARALLSLLAVEARARILQASAQFLRRPALFAIVVDPTGEERAAALAGVGRHVAMPVHRVDAAEMRQGVSDRENFRRLLESASRAGVILFLDNAERVLGGAHDPDGAGARDGFPPQFLLECLETGGVVIAAVADRSEIAAQLLIRARFVVDFTVPADQMPLDLT
jgi:hypothetical protein